MLGYNLIKSNDNHEIKKCLIDFLQEIKNDITLSSHDTPESLSQI